MQFCGSLWVLILYLLTLSLIVEQFCPLKHSACIDITMASIPLGGVNVIVVSIVFEVMALGAFALRMWALKLRHKALCLNDYAIIVAMACYRHSEKRLTNDPLADPDDRNGRRRTHRHALQLRW